MDGDALSLGGATDLDRFLATFLYEPEAFLVDEVIRVDEGRHEIEARLDTTRRLPIARYQRAGPDYPMHLTAAELIMVTACLGALHAWFFYGCRWDEGWIGFGNRINRADFKGMALVGPPLDLRSRDALVRAGTQRLVLQFDFSFSQNGTPVYRGDQTALFVRRGAAGR